jgi:hypothetical protein
MGDERITVFSLRVLHCLALVLQAGCNQILARGDPSDGVAWLCLLCKLFPFCGHLLPYTRACISII